MQRIEATLKGIKNSRFPGIMAHMIAGFPDIDTSYAVGRALADNGAAMLEVQIPFSDPVADGPVIQNASAHVLRNGYTMRDYATLLEQLRNAINIPIVVMTYANIVWAYGVERFVAMLHDCGADGIIIPDFPMENDEGLRECCKTNDLALIPVAAPGCSPERIRRLSCYGSGLLYTAIRRGTTGAVSVFSEESRSWLSCVTRNSVLPCAVGFGIHHREQVVALAPFAQIAVAGSCIVHAISEAHTHKKNCASAAGEIVSRLML